MHGVLLDTSNTGTQWGAIAVAVLTIIYVVFIRPLKKGKKDPLARKPTDGALAQQRAMERDMSALLVEYEQMMRTMSAQIETRVAKLELLIRDADERLAAMQHADAGEPAPAAASTPISISAGSDAELATLLADNGPPRHSEVYKLADDGLSFRQIAQRLDRPYGEIELILALRAKPNAPAPIADRIAAASEREDLTVLETVRREGELALAGAASGLRPHPRPSAMAEASDDRGQSQRRKKRR